MTAPTPGFPPELETAIAEALAEHRLTGLAGGFGYSFDAKTHMCRCDRRWISESEYADHLAAVVMETIAQHTTTEWGVDYLDGSYDVHEDQQMAEDFAGGGTVVSRLVLPWQEVEA